MAGLVLGAIGPIGLKAGSDGKPHLRFCPIVFLLAQSEDEESQGLLVKKIVEVSKAVNVTLVHGFFRHCLLHWGTKSVGTG